MKKRVFFLLATVVLALFGVAAGLWFCRGGGFVLLTVSRMDADKQAGRRRLLCETNHAKLLAACRELLRRVEAGDLSARQYGFGSNPDPAKAQFPKVIVALEPSCVYVEAGRIMIEMMGGMDHYGVSVYREDYSGEHFAGFRYGDRELVPGLWYYDDGYDENPRYDKKVEALLNSDKR